MLYSFCSLDLNNSKDRHGNVGSLGERVVKGMRRLLTLVWIVVLLGLCACSPRPDYVPSIQLESPTDGIQIAVGESVLVQSSAQDKLGVAKVELWVDQRLYEVHRSKVSGGESPLDVIQIWPASSLGEHTLTVKAFAADGRVSEPTSAQVVVVEASLAPTPTPVLTPTVVGEETCEPSARFVEDVTVPDDSLFNGGVNFTKTWRLRNDSECRWPEGTVWVFIGGALLGAESPVTVERAEPDRIVDISVDMVAPGAPGTYKSTWRLQTAEGEFFGDQAYVRIIVP
jgi:hypothetical protein